jgi:hypothetical protein
MNLSRFIVVALLSLGVMARGESPFQFDWKATSITRAITFPEKSKHLAQELISIWARVSTPVNCSEGKECSTKVFAFGRLQTGESNFRGNWGTLGSFSGSFPELDFDEDIKGFDLKVRNLVVGASHQFSSGMTAQVELGSLTPVSGQGSATRVNPLGYIDGFRGSIFDHPELGDFQVTVGSLEQWYEPDTFERAGNYHTNFVEVRMTREVFEKAIGSAALIHHDSLLVADLSVKRDFLLSKGSERVLAKVLTAWAGLLGDENGELKYEVGVGGDLGNLLFAKSSKIKVKAIFTHMDSQFSDYGFRYSDAYSWMYGDSLGLFFDWEFRPGQSLGLHSVIQLKNPTPLAEKETFAEIWYRLDLHKAAHGWKQKRERKRERKRWEAKERFCQKNVDHPNCEAWGLN